MEVTDVGMETEDNTEQPSKADSLMVFIDVGILRESR